VTGGVRWDQVVVHSLVERGREDPLHHADGVGVQSFLDLASLEDADVSRGEFPKPDPAEEGYQVVAAGSLVAREGALAHMITSRICKPAREVFAYRELPRIGEVDPLVCSARAWSFLLLASSAVAP